MCSLTMTDCGIQPKWMAGLHIPEVTPATASGNACQSLQHCFLKMNAQGLSLGRWKGVLVRHSGGAPGHGHDGAAAHRRPGQTHSRPLRLLPPHHRPALISQPQPLPTSLSSSLISKGLKKSLSSSFRTLPPQLKINLFSSSK